MKNWNAEKDGKAGMVRVVMKLWRLTDEKEAAVVEIKGT